MDEGNTPDMLNHSRWLINNGILNDVIKNNLFTYGAIVNRNVEAVELDIDVTNFKLNYNIYFKKNMLNTINKYNELSNSSSIWGMWRFSRLLKKHGSLNIRAILQKFVTDYCGSKWSVEVKLIDVKDYKEGSSEGSRADSTTN